MTSSSPLAVTAPRLYRGRVVFIEDRAADVRLLRIELEHKQKLSFLAGQYAVLENGLDEPRAFSIASAPYQPYLEFHVKNAGHGLSQFLTEKLTLGDTLSLSAPLGESYWHPSERPLLALAGGVGIVPLKSIIEDLLQGANVPPVSLYWGARDESHLYLDAEFSSLSKNHPRFRYIPVLSDEKTDRRRQGLLPDILREDFETLSGWDIYLAGPREMVETTLPFLKNHGAEEEYIFGDALKMPRTPV